MKPYYEDDLVSETWTCRECGRSCVTGDAWKKAAGTVQRDNWKQLDIRQGTKARALCRPCWLRLRRLPDFDARYPNMRLKICAVEGCEREHCAHGYCELHMLRIQRSGTTDLPRRATADERFWAKVDKTATCWLWTAAISDSGYGIFNTGTRNSNGDIRNSPAHRYAYELLTGPIPDGLVLDHLCRIRNCVNPDHLDAVTNAVNILRGISPSAIRARSTKCIHGHPFDAANTYWRSDGRGRDCRKCARIRRTRRAIRERR